jgi:phosphate starvation-inducible PhoH-like protein
MILDEAQNATFEQIKMFITRIGIHSRAVINGDADQSDLPMSIRGGLEDISHRLENLDGVGICELEASDIVRNKIIGRILERLK